jgi:hypothetical protein
MRSLTATPAGLVGLATSLRAAGMTALTDVTLLAAPAVESSSTANGANANTNSGGGLAPGAVIGVAVGASLGGAALLTLSIFAFRNRAALAALYRRADTPAPKKKGALSKPPRFRYDVFLSYRRDDAAIVDTIEDKLCHTECALRVFRDVRGHMAGADFDVELLRCMLRRCDALRCVAC